MRRRMWKLDSDRFARELVDLGLKTSRPGWSLAAISRFIPRTSAQAGYFSRPEWALASVDRRVKRMLFTSTGGSLC